MRSQQGRFPAGRGVGVALGLVATSAALVALSLVHPDDFARFGRLHLVAEVNPYHLSDDNALDGGADRPRAVARCVCIPEAQECRGRP